MQLEERRREDKPHLRAGRGLVSIAVLQLGYSVGQLQRCDHRSQSWVGFTALRLSAQVYDVQCPLTKCLVGTLIIAEVLATLVWKLL